MENLSDDVKRIGLMADSHGNPKALLRCIEIFNAFKTDIIVHLGDFFDSQYTEDSLEVMKTIVKENIFAVKGNNDYQFERSISNGCSEQIPLMHRKKIQSFLKSVPLKRTLQNICFVHSLPYDSIRSFYEPIDNGSIDRAERIFMDTSYQLIFSGHSHVPVLFRYRHNHVTRESINYERPTTLYDNERFIIIVGSADDGDCGFIDLSQKLYQRIKI